MNYIILFLSIIILYFVFKKALTIYATVLFNGGKKEKALKILEFAYKFLKLSPYNKALYSYFLLKQGELLKASEILNLLLLDKQLKLSDKYFAKSLVAIIKWKQGDINDAVEIMDEILKKFKTTLYYANAGFFYILKGDLLKALELNLKAYEFNSSNGMIQDNLAENYLLLEKYDDAKKIFDELMEKNPKFPEAYFHFGNYYEKINELENAITYYKKALEFDYSFLSPITKNDVLNRLNELEKSYGNRENTAKL